MKNSFKKTVSLLLAVLMVMTMLPVTAIAEEIENLGCTHHPFHNDECGYIEAAEEVPCGHICSEECGEECTHEHDEVCGYAPAVLGEECSFHCEICEADVVYSDEIFHFSGNSFIPETAGTSEIILSRENSGKETSALVVIYDYSANYEKDYTVLVNGTEVEKIEGSRSFFDVFAEEGENMNGAEIDAVAAVGKIYEEEISEDMKASDMFAELDSFGVRAVEIPVAFEKGEDSIVLTVKVIDDEENEYDESFMLAVFDEKGEAVETAQALINIEDNEEEPEVSITFDCEKELGLNEEGKAELKFKREGNLAANSLAVLFLDGNPLGYVDFAPYQTEQIVDAVYTGVYMLGDENGNITDMTEIVVYDPMASGYSVPEGADPELDAVPEVYATIPDVIKATSSWFPEWAKTTGYRETETQKIFMGTVGSSYWRNYSNNSKGSTSYFPDGLNEVHVNTSGDFSHVSSGTNKVTTEYTYNLTGIASIEVVGNLSGVDKNAKIGLEVDNCTGWHNTVTSGGTYTMTATAPEKYQGNSSIYVYNRDPQSSGGGTNFHITNGFVLNKRQYYIEMRDDLSPSLSYYGGESTHPFIDGNNDLIKVYPGDNQESYNKVNIIYNADTGYPARLKAYKLYNNSTKKTSAEINLNGSSGFYFTKKFLTSYENSYCWSGDADGNGTGDSVFSVIPVYEKIGVDYEIKSAKGGDIVLQNPNGKLYMGDKAVFKNADSSELKLVAVEWKAYNDLSSGIAASGTQDADADGLVRFKLCNLYTYYEFKGIYSADATSLSVYYQEENPKGKLGMEGIVVPAEKYVKNDYVTLTAKPDENYITKWIVDTDVYYGDVLYYMLTGNPDENKIYVSFVPKGSEGIKTLKISGFANTKSVDLRTKYSDPIALIDAEITVTAGKTYNVKTDDKGKFVINDFEGVPGAKYTALINYGGGFNYQTFKFDESGACTLSVPQFAVGDSFPAEVTASLNGGSGFTNAIPLEAGGNVNIRVAVQGNSSSKPVKVTLHFYDTVNNMGSLYEKEITEQTEAIGDVSYWDISIPAEDIPFNTQLYVSVDSEKTIILKDENGNFVGSETYTATSAPAKGGYLFSPDYEDSSIPVYYDVPSTPEPTDAADVFAEDLEIPLLGRADFTLSSNSGGFFVTRTDPETGYIYLMCGYSFEGLYAKGNIVDKYSDAKKSGEEAKKHSIGKKKSGSSEPAVQTMTGENNNETAPNGSKKQSNWTFSPAFMFKIAAKPGTQDPNTYYIAGYEAVVGFDAWFFKNFPFNVYGVPMYVSVSFGMEAVLQMAMNFKDDAITLEDANFMNVTNAMGDYLHDEESAVAAIEGIIGAPRLAVGVKGGVGVNNFLSAFIAADVRIPILFQLEPTFQVAGQIGFDISAGADLVIFTGKFTANVLDIYYGDNEDDDDDKNGIANDEGDSDLVGSLKSIQGRVNSVALNRLSSEAETVYVDREEFDFEEELNKMTFSLMSRSGGATLRGISSPETISKDTFKNTGIHLWEFENGKLAAAYLRDNGEEGLNYLSAVYAVSEDNGKTWSEEKYFSDNTGENVSSLQYDINIFELQDRMLITWSEADFDKLITEMDLEVDNLSAAHVARLMGAMNLKGVFVDKYDGHIISEPFTIAENSTVACGVLDAVQNGENVYVYYQRNAVPDRTDMALEELLSLDRTVALARANVNSSESWTSTPVRVENEDGQQYRIVNVEPFSYKGIVGEVIAIDRDGKFAVPKAEGNWENSDDDRMLFLRTYVFNEETGAPETAALINMTDAATCSQNPQIVTNGEDIYLFFNQDGNIVYLKNFVADETSDEETKEYSAFAVENADGSYTVKKPLENYAKNIASHGSIYYGTKFTVTMDEKGDIFICWIADEEREGVVLATEEIYGIMLRSVTNGKAFELMGIEEVLTAEEAAEEQLWAVGRPVAITDENGLFGALDSICTDAEKGEFLLGYTKLNSSIRTSVTAADVKVVNGNPEPELVVDSIEYDEYPKPGTEAEIIVTVKNEGFEPVHGVVISANGNTISGETESKKTLWPGTGENFTVKVRIPENFSKTENVDITVSGKGEQSVYSAETSAEIIYGAYFAISEVSQRSIPGTKDLALAVSVENMGNAAGKPEVSVKNSIFGIGDDIKEYSFSGEAEVAPGEAAVVEGLIEDTYINEEQTSQISVRTGEKFDQFIQKFMPKPAELLAEEKPDDEKPDSVHEHDWSEWETVNGIRSRSCASCGMVVREYIINIDKADDEQNPETGAPAIVFEKCAVNYIDTVKAFDKKRRR